MAIFQVAEHFISINGEGRKAGQLAHFIRFAGCNLACGYCDTGWAKEVHDNWEGYSEQELYQLIRKAGIVNVTLTGGEPLLQNGIAGLLLLLGRDPDLQVEIETNGSVELFESGIPDSVSFTLDYKLPGSGMEQYMCTSNYERLRSVDVVKFVVSDRTDLWRSKEIIETYHLIDQKCGIYLSPCFGRMEPAEIVEFLVEQNMNHVNVQLQLHKLIWDPEQRGV